MAEQRKRFPVMVTHNQLETIEELSLLFQMSRSEWIRYASMHHKPTKKQLNYTPLDTKASMIWTYFSDKERNHLDSMAKKYDVAVSHLIRTAACFHEMKWGAQ